MDEKPSTTMSIYIWKESIYGGPSGSGKTTLLNAIARLEKPDQGRILLNKQDIWKMKEKDYFKLISGLCLSKIMLVEEEAVFDNLSYWRVKSRNSDSFKTGWTKWVCYEVQNL